MLSQKPFAVDLAAARAMVEHAERKGVRLAVNQNGRWAPPWRVATLLMEQGQIGEVCAVTHLFEHDFDWTVGTPFDEIEHFVLYDFAVHWIDITRCWLADKSVATVTAREYRTPAQAAGQKAPWGALVVVDYTDGASAVIRSVGVSTRRARQSVLGAWDGRDDTREHSQADRFRRARAGRDDPALLALAASGSPTASPGRWPSCAARSQRIVSRSTPRATTCSRWS